MLIVKSGTFAKNIHDEKENLIKLSLIETGEMIGITEILEKEVTFNIKLTCESSVGVLYFIPVEELNKYMNSKK